MPGADAATTESHKQAVKSSQELLPKYTEQERQLTCPEGVCVQAVFQQPELRGMSARARLRVTLRMVLVLCSLSCCPTSMARWLISYKL